MKKLLSILVLLIISIVPSFGNPNEFDLLYDNYQAVYTPSESTWTAGGIADDSIVLTKKLIEGTGSYSKYLYEDGSLGFALCTDLELIKNGRFVVVDNNLLKYSKIVYEDGNFLEVPLTFEEIQNTFPDAEILRMSWIDSDNKIWIHKPFFKKKIILLVNDTDKYFHKLTCSSKSAQKSEVKGLITISHYGIYRFKHFGERNGKLTIYVR